MEDETRQPRLPEDYMAIIVASLGVNTPHDAWQWVEDRKSITPLVFTDGEGKLGYVRGVKVGAWLMIAQAISKMAEDTTI